MSYINDPQPERSSDDLFGEVISTYTDAEAIDDGFLVELHPAAAFLGLPINRMTRHLFDDLQPALHLADSAFLEEISQALASILRTKCAFAQGDPGNTGEIGDIYTIPPNLWLVRNEVGGWPGMYPADY